MKAKTLIMIVLPAACLLGLTLALIPAQEPADPGGGGEAPAPPATPAELEQLLGAGDAPAPDVAPPPPADAAAPADQPPATPPAADTSAAAPEDVEAVPVPEDSGSEFLQLTDDDDVQIPGMEQQPEDEEAQERFSITLDDVPLEDVVDMFIKISKANIIVTSTNLVGKSVTVNLTDVEWKPALNSILNTHGLMLSQTPGTEVYTIAPRQPDAAPPMVVKTHILKHANTGEIIPVLRSMLVPGGNITAFASRNALVFRSTEDNIAEMQELLKELDIAVKQVCIETKFMELNDEATKQLGIKWDSLEEFGIRLGAGPFTSSEEITREKTKETALTQWDSRNTLDETYETYDLDGEPYEEGNTADYSGGAPVSGNVLDSGSMIPTRTVTDIIDTGKDVQMDVMDAFAQTITEKQAAILELDSLSVIMSALKKTDGVTIISNPKIIVTSGYSNAVFRVGQKEPIITTEITRGTTDSPGDKVVAKLDTGIRTESIEGGFITTGIELRVVPTVKTDEFIEAKIDPVLTRKLGNKTVGDNSWPIMSVKQIATQFTLKSGQTVAIGGLTDTSDDNKVSKIPLLGNIPIVGKYLFSHTQERKTQVETIVFVTLSLAAPETLHKNDGIPEDAELVHKQLIRSNARRQQFQTELDEMREDADAEMAKKADKVKSRLLKKRK